jgi:DNA topoisomerase II
LKNLEKHEIDITSLKENHSVEGVKFEIIAKKTDLDRLEKARGGMAKKLGLSSIITTENMHAFDGEMKLQYYPTPESLIEGYFPLRLEGYYRRKERQLAILTGEELKLRNQSKFVSEIYSGNIALTSAGRPISTDSMNQTLREKGFAPQKDIDAIIAKYLPISRSSATTTSDTDDYSYLLSLPIRSLTLERAQALQNRATQTQLELESLRALTPEEMWLAELQILREKLLEFDPSFQLAEEESSE